MYQIICRERPASFNSLYNRYNVSCRIDPKQEKFDTSDIIWTASSEFGTYRLCEQRRFRRACASAQSHQNLRCSLIQAVSQEESSDKARSQAPLNGWACAVKIYHDGMLEDTNSLDGAHVERKTKFGVNILS